MGTSGNLPSVVADLDRRRECSSAVCGLPQNVVAHLFFVDLAIDEIDCLAAVSEANPQFAALAQTFTGLIIFCQCPAGGVELHQIELSRFRIVDAPVDPCDQEISVRHRFDNRKPCAIFNFIQGP